jgi:hypothetical protein
LGHCVRDTHVMSGKIIVPNSCMIIHIIAHLAGLRSVYLYSTRLGAGLNCALKRLVSLSGAIDFRLELVVRRQFSVLLCCEQDSVLTVCVRVNEWLKYRGVLQATVSRRELRLDEAAMNTVYVVAVCYSSAVSGETSDREAILSCSQHSEQRDVAAVFFSHRNP